MKKLTLSIVLILLSAGSTFAQAKFVREKLKKDDLPDAVIQAISKDFPDGKVVDFGGLPVTVIEDEVYVYPNEDVADNDTYDTYVVTLSGQSGDIRATYDKEGDLLGRSEHMKDIALPHAVDTAISENFPGWTVASDKMKMTSHKSGKEKVRYRLKLKKDGKHHRVVLDEDGNILRGKEK